MRHTLVRLSPARSAHLLLLLLAAACSGKGGNPAAPSATPDSSSLIAYTAVGASDAAGVGASVVCVPFAACPDGTGYVPVIARDLQAGGATVTLMNLGIPAAVLSRRIQDIGNAYGRGIPGNLIDDEAPFVPKTTTLLTIFAGGNDTNTIATAVANGAGGSDRNAYVDAQVQAFAGDYATLISAVRQRAPSAKIVVANLPNFAGMPYTAGLSPADKLIMQRISVGFSTQAVNPLASQGIAVVDLLCDARFLQPSIFSSDGFHPNDTGYRLLADVMLNAIRQPTYPAPQSSCDLMTLAGPR
jgi:lysophospholipase L1-like esterase